MSDAARFNIASQRNEDFGPFEGRFEDADGEPTDLTGWSFQLRIDDGPGAEPFLLTIGETKNANGSYLRVIEPTGGRIELCIGQDDIAALPGDPTEDTELFYNLITLEADGTRRVFARGRFIAELGLGMFDRNVGILVTEGGDFLVTEDGSILRF